MKNEKRKMKNDEPEQAENQTPMEDGVNEAAPELSEDTLKQAVIDALTDRLQRTMAEFDNFRKRTAKEKASMYDNGVRDAVEKFLPVADNLERALLSVESAEDRESPVYKGVEMIFRQTNQILCDMGLEPLPGEGEPFDPNCHDAVASEGEGDGEAVVAEVLQKGYRYGDKVVRPSMVKVRK